MSPDAISHLHNMMQAGFATLADLQRETNQRLDHAVERLDRHETLLERLVDKVVVLDNSVVALSGQLQSLDQRFDNFLTGSHGRSHHDVERRLKRLEQHADFGCDSSPQ